MSTKASSSGPQSPIASVKRPRKYASRIDGASKILPPSIDIETEPESQDGTWQKMSSIFSPVLKYLNTDGSSDEVEPTQDAFEEPRRHKSYPHISLDEAANTLPTVPGKNCRPPAEPYAENANQEESPTENDTNTNQLQPQLQSQADEADSENAPEENKTTAAPGSADTAPPLNNDDASADEEDENGNAKANANDDDEEDSYEEFNPYLFMKHLPPYEEVCVPNKICLPPRKITRHSPALTLVLDLDETLVHCTIEETDQYDLCFPVDFNGAEYQVKVRKRPFLDEFLTKMGQLFEVVVFTASQRVYADRLLNILDPEKKLIKHRLFRESCLPVEGNFLKDLNVLGRDLSRVVLVDNSPHAFGYQTDNGVPIESWFDDKEDTELVKLGKFLEELRGVGDVRPVLRKTFRTYQLIEMA